MTSDNLSMPIERSRSFMVFSRVLRWTWLRWVLLFAIITLRIAILYHDGPVVGTDQAFQLAGAQSLLNGQGLSIEVFETTDISHLSPFYIVWWPPPFLHGSSCSRTYPRSSFCLVHLDFGRHSPYFCWMVHSS